MPQAVSSNIIVTERHGGRVIEAALNNPQKGNALNLSLIHELTAFFQNIPKTGAHAVILSGKGEHFCSGGDLSWLKAPPDKTDLENLNEVSLLYKLFHSIDRCPAPVTGMAHGSVFGGGIGLIAACDTVFCDKNARFCFSEIKLSLLPAVVSPFVLKKISLSHARRLMLSGVIFSADEALRIGLVHFSGDAKECKGEAAALTSRLIQYNRTALKQTKEALHRIPFLDPTEAKDYCVKALAERRKDPSVTEQINRFLKAKASAAAASAVADSAAAASAGAPAAPASTTTANPAAKRKSTV